MGLWSARWGWVCRSLGDPRRGVFVSVPEAGLEILRVLEDGGTIGDARAAFALACGEPVKLVDELQEFLGALVRKGFLAPLRGAARDPVGRGEAGRKAVVSAGRVRVSRMVFGGWALLGYWLVICVGIGLIVTDPAVIPGPHVLVFDRQAGLMLGLLFGVTVVAIALHEGAHVLAAGRLGCARVGIGRRLWFLVFETDISGIGWRQSVNGMSRHRWHAGRRGDDHWAGRVHRAASHGRSASRPSPSICWVRCCSGICCGVAACVRADRFVLCAGDVAGRQAAAGRHRGPLLRNQLARLRGRPAPVDQSAIPAGEMRAVRGYAWVWIAGRVLAVASLVLITVPVGRAYIADVTSGQQSPAAMLLGAGVGLLFWGGGLAAFTLGLIRRLTV